MREETSLLTIDKLNPMIVVVVDAEMVQIVVIVAEIDVPVSVVVEQTKDVKLRNPNPFIKEKSLLLCCNLRELNIEGSKKAV